MAHVAETNYDRLYAEGYFAHDPGSSSFDQSAVPDILINHCRASGLRGVIDLGAGNSLLGNALRAQGIRCIDVDIAMRTGVDYLRCDLSQAGGEEIERIRSHAISRLGSDFLVTCFDMAEHIDIEHLGNFICNLNEIITDQAIISISTRPSSRANIFHCSILPIDTWKYMFSLVGLHAEYFDPLQAHRSGQIFRSANQELFAVSYWQKRNPFGDHPSHQHYLHLVRTSDSPAPRRDVTERISSVLDIKYRHHKRHVARQFNMPQMVFLVSFIQDWAFLRSLLDIWPRENVRVLIRQDFIANRYTELMAAYLDRLDIEYAVTETANEAAKMLRWWEMGKGSLLLTATEGLPTALHLMASLTVLQARRLGMTTATLQHGFQISPKNVPGAQFFLGSDESACNLFRLSLASDTCEPLALGDMKNLDARLVEADPDAIAFRLGGEAKHYRARILVGTNLHWMAHGESAEGVAKWLKTVAQNNPDVLFLLRPHPDDWRILQTPEWAQRSNMRIIDEPVLLCIDWPLSRILASVDGVISTHSTLIADSLAAGRPTAILSTGISDPFLVETEATWIVQGAVAISLDGRDCGSLPVGWPSAVLQPAVALTDLYDTFIRRLLGILAKDDDPAKIERAETSVYEQLQDEYRNLSFDSHPHANRQAVNDALDRLLT